jgi:K(+)-stimulated pyrophosphate-energized sodium pump
LLFAAISFFNMKKEGTGTELMQKIAEAIHTGAMVYLKRQYTAIAIFVVAMTVVLAFAINPLTAGCFVVGASLSALAGYIGMTAATMANVRTTHAQNWMAQHSAFRSRGMVKKLTVVGLAARPSAVYYEMHSTVGIYEVIVSFQVLFARVPLSLPVLAGSSPLQMFDLPNSGCFQC